jgi:hypothetical protein
MKLSLTVTALALMLSAAEAAPRIEMRIKSGFFATETTVFHASGSRTNLGYLVDSCKHNVGGMKDICVDSARRRAHVLYKDGYKRRFRQGRTWIPAGCPECLNIDFPQATCNW